MQIQERLEGLMRGFNYDFMPGATFDDMGLDSLDLVELVMAVEEEFDLEIPDSDAERISGIPEAVAYLEQRLAA